MGKYRSRSGCLTCRQRRVKCDEVRPVCGQCSKKTRDCQWEPAGTRFRGFRPSSHSSGSTASPALGEARKDKDDGEGKGEGVGVGVGVGDDGGEGDGDGDGDGEGEGDDNYNDDDHGDYQDLGKSHPQIGRGDAHVSGDMSIQSAALPSKERYALEKHEARLLRHYIEHLGRWLDSTDPARQFTQRVPMEARHCHILLRAIQSFAARHLGDDTAADGSYEHCIGLLIERLNLNIATHDEDLLCAIVILHYFEQLNVPSTPLADSEQHLTGSSAILRASQHDTVDPSAPTLREAAFWIYVRQCLFKSTMDQQPPNVDFSLRLHPEPATMRDHHPLAQLRLETAWANQMTWHCACIANFCFDRSDPEPTNRLRRWQELWDAVEDWKQKRPICFEPLWSGNANTGVFPEVFFTADWHLIATTYMHFAYILLLTYKPGPKFAIRNLQGKLSDTDHQILVHARQLCGSCKSAPMVASNLIVLCHTIFIWGPLLSDAGERIEVLEILKSFQSIHKWPTTWIIASLKAEWDID